MNNLVIKNSTVPIKAISKETLKETLEGTFAVWISNLLGLTGEDAAKRLIIALPAIEKHFWSMGFDEIEKAFTMYADGELITKPLPNYFTRILVGQIFKEYKQQKPRHKNPVVVLEISEEDKKLNEILSATICFDYYVQNGFLNDTSLYLYNVLKDKFEFKQREQDKLIERSKQLDKPIEAQRAHYKKLCLIRYFDRLYVQGKHLKDII